MWRNGIDWKRSPDTVLEKKAPCLKEAPRTRRTPRVSRSGSPGTRGPSDFGELKLLRDSGDRAAQLPRDPSPVRGTQGHTAGPEGTVPQGKRCGTRAGTELT